MVDLGNTIRNRVWFQTNNPWVLVHVCDPKRLLGNCSSNCKIHLYHVTHPNNFMQSHYRNMCLLHKLTITSSHTCLRFV